MDEPSTTQPMLYDAVRKHPTVKQIFAEKLVNEGVLTEEVVQNIEKSVTKRIEDAYQKVPAKRNIPPLKLNFQSLFQTVSLMWTHPLILMCSVS